MLRDIDTTPPLAERPPADGSLKAVADHRRLIAIAMMCGTMVFFTAHDASAKWLAGSLPMAEIVWARYIAAAIFGLFIVRPFSRPALMRSNRPALQALRSLLLLGSTAGNFFALREMQLAETSTISFLWPLFVALMAGPLLNEWAGPARLAAIGVGLIGVIITMTPGTGAFQPAALLAVAGVVCNSGYSILTRSVAAHDRAETTLAWTPLAGILLLTPVLPFVWVAPPTLTVFGVIVLMGLCATVAHGLMIVAHKRAPAPVLAPFAYTQLIWMVLAGILVFGDKPPAKTLVGAAIVIACGLFLLSRERGAAKAAPQKLADPL